MVINSERVSFWCRPSDAHCVPFAVVQPGPGSVPDPDRAVTQVEHVMNVSVDQLHGDEVAFSTGVVQNQTVRFACSELQGEKQRVNRLKRT